MSLFDTSYLIKLIKERKFEQGSISVITLIEFLRGVSRERRKIVKELLESSFDVIGLDNDVVMEYCELYEKLKKSGELIPDADLLIAATARAKNLKVKTMDKDFERLRKYGVSVEIA